MITGDEGPGAEALYYRRQQEQGGVPMFRDRNGNWRPVVVTEE